MHTAHCQLETVNCLLNSARLPDIRRRKACDYRWLLLTANCSQIPGALHRAIVSDPFWVNFPNIFF